MPTPADRFSTSWSWPARWRSSPASSASTCSPGAWSTARSAPITPGRPNPWTTAPASCASMPARTVISARKSSGITSTASPTTPCSTCKDQERQPDIMHSHYADAGYVGARLAAVLGVPLVHTGHSLGRVKRRRLLAAGLKRGPDRAALQHGPPHRGRGDDARCRRSGDHQHPQRDRRTVRAVRLLSAGAACASSRRAPTWNASTRRPSERAPAADRHRRSTRFLRQPDKPMILALSRPDERKNITTLLEAYGESHGAAGRGQPGDRRRQPRGHPGTGQRRPERADRHSAAGRSIRPVRQGRLPQAPSVATKCR